MAKRKKVVTESSVKPKVETIEFSKEDINAALDVAHREYFMNVLALLSHDKTYGELGYVKAPMITPDGGTYLLCIMHVDGPKINLKNLASAAEAVEAKDVKSNETV